jgi:hypothetical protein
MKGKTVKMARQRACNVVEIAFTDGSYLELWAENGLYGIPVIEVDTNATEIKHIHEGVYY